MFTSPPRLGVERHSLPQSAVPATRPGPEEAAISARTYKDAGVDIDEGNALVEAIKPLARGTARAGTTAGLGGFAAAFDPRAAGFRDPILFATTDGVGTKLKIAIATGRHETVGIDLVAMCVNDLVVSGAQPLFFLDYYATPRLSAETGRAVIAGIAAGCREADCALIGGETAELPGLYAAGDYDLAGFAVGAAERDQVLTPERVRAGDVILGLASSGLHSNGFSLVRRVVADLGLAYDEPAPFAPRLSLGEALLTPTRIYVRSALAALAAGGVHGFAHITGGGLVENIPRILPDGLGAEIDAQAWALPPVFRWLMSDGGVAPGEMARTFNCGIGMVVVVDAAQADTVIVALTAAGETVSRLGTVSPTGPGAADDAAARIRLTGLEHWR